MANDGLFVICHSWAPKQKTKPHTVSRVQCVLQTDEHCKECPNSRFVLHVPVEVGNQTVSCPRWKEGSLLDKSPDEYVQIRRELCLTRKPFPFCPSCPNSTPTNPPRAQPGWVDGWSEKKKRRYNDE